MPSRLAARCHRGFSSTSTASSGNCRWAASRSSISRATRAGMAVAIGRDTLLNRSPCGKKARPNRRSARNTARLPLRHEVLLRGRPLARQADASGTWCGCSTFRANGTAWSCSPSSRKFCTRPHPQAPSARSRRCRIRAVSVRACSMAPARLVHAHKPHAPDDRRPSNILPSATIGTGGADFGAAPRARSPMSDQPVLKPTYSTPGIRRAGQYARRAPSSVRKWTGHLRGCGSLHACIVGAAAARGRTRREDRSSPWRGPRPGVTAGTRSSSSTGAFYPTAAAARPACACAAEGADPSRKSPLSVRTLVRLWGGTGRGSSSAAAPTALPTIHQPPPCANDATTRDRIAHCYLRDALLMLVADGMGGHLHGEVAAQIAVQCIAERSRAEARPCPTSAVPRAIERARTAIPTMRSTASRWRRSRTTWSCVIQRGAA